MRSRHHVFILGTGKVGNEIIKQIASGEQAKGVNPTEIVIAGLASSSAHKFNHDGVSYEEALDFAAKKIRGVPVNGNADASIMEFLMTAEHDLFVIDVTNAQTKSLHLNILKRTEHSVITANKNPVANANRDEFKTMSLNSRKYNFIPTIFAGSDAVERLFYKPEDVYGDVSLAACLSGTSVYILSEIEARAKYLMMSKAEQEAATTSGKTFSEALESAKNLGFTEPNFMNDLNGNDAKNKLLIIARLLGNNVELDDVKAYSIVPPPLSNIFFESVKMSDEDKANEIKALDDLFDRAMMQALRRENPQTLRHVARLQQTETDKPRLTVQMENVELDSDLAVRGVNNRMILQRLGKIEIISAKGAGADLTAKNILGMIRRAQPTVFFAK